MTTEEAVSHGIRATAGVVTSAAVVMVGVFAIFATLSSIDFKMMGIGLALAVLLDATIVRAVLLPATMKLLGDWNWYLPSWLEWLPHVAPETSREAVEIPASHLDLAVSQTDGRTSLELDGELDLETAPLLRARLQEVEPEARTLVVDLRRVTFMDSSGIGELLGAHQRARRQHRRIVLVRRDGSQVSTALHVSAIDTMLETKEAPPEEVGPVA